MLFVAIVVTEDPERVPLFKMIFRFFDTYGYPRIKKNCTAVTVISDPDRVALIQKALYYFRICGYPEKWYRNHIVDPKGRVCFLYPGEAIFCFCPVSEKVIETRI